MKTAGSEHQTLDKLFSECQGSLQLCLRIHGAIPARCCLLSASRVMPSDSHLATSGCYFSRLKDVALRSMVVVITQPTDPARPNLSLLFQAFPALSLSCPFFQFVVLFHPPPSQVPFPSPLLCLTGSPSSSWPLPWPSCLCLFSCYSCQLFRKT